MADNLTWRSFDALAERLEKRFPDAALPTLRNARLTEMVGEVCADGELCAPPDDEKELQDVCFGIKIAWTRRRGNGTPLSANVEQD